MRSINLVVNVGTYTKNVRFYVVDKLTSVVILCYDYFDVLVDAIRQRLKIVQMEDGSTVSIVQETSKANTAVPFPEKQQFDTHKDCTSQKMKVT